MKETYYFSHDYNARSDEKIKTMQRKHGMEGIGIYWCLVEDLYQNANALQLDYEGIAYDLRVDAKKVESIINDFGLFEIQDSIFGSISIERRLELRNEKSEKARDSANSRWKKEKDNANAMRTQCDSNAIKESKVKESKVKDSKINKNSVCDFSESGELFQKFKELHNSYQGGKRTALSDWMDFVRQNEAQNIPDIVNSMEAALKAQSEWRRKARENEHLPGWKYFKNWLFERDWEFQIPKSEQQKENKQLSDRLIKQRAYQDTILKAEQEHQERLKQNQNAGTTTTAK